MSIPTYQEFMYPFLQILSDKNPYTLKQMYALLADKFQLTDEERTQLLPSGKQLIFHNRIGWAKFYLSKAGLIENMKRAVFKITDEGLKVITDSSIHQIDKKFLERYPSFQAFIQRNEEQSPTSSISVSVQEQTPHEALESNFQILKEEVCQELLEKILKCSPDFFERLVVEMIVAMGYGGSIQEAGKAIGKSGDEGIDGVIKEDVLGLDLIYLQAKRWAINNTVSRPEIQKFVGSLEGKRASKGIFITTSSFTKEARNYVMNIGKRVILIDGQALSNYMFQYNIGVSNQETYIVKKIDSDFFEN